MLKNRTIAFSLFAIAALLSTATVSHPGELELKLSDEVLFRTGSAFEGEGEYYRAVTEYKKLLILFPESGRAEDASFHIGLSYLKGGEYAPAAAAFRSLREKFPKGRRVVESHLYEGLSSRKLGDFGNAINQLETVVRDFPGYATPRALAEQALLAYTWNEFNEAKEHLNKIVQDYPGDELAATARQALKLENSRETLPRKSTVLAGALSALLPGSGYVYAGSYGDGASAFLVNAVFIAGTATAIHQRNYPTAYIVGAVGLPFYIGNIYGSANAAHTWNLAVRKEIDGKISSLLEWHY